MTINDFFASIESNENELFVGAKVLRSEDSIVAIMDGTDGLAEWDPWS